MKKVNCFLPALSVEQILPTVNELRSTKFADDLQIFILSKEKLEVEGCSNIISDNINSMETLRSIAENSNADFTLIYTKYTTLSFAQYGL